MIDPLDKKTSNLSLDSGEASPTSPESPPTPEPATIPEPAPAASKVVKIQAPELPDEDKLNREFDLVRLRTPVYMWDKKKAAQRSAGADRVAKHREKLAAEGLRQTAVPVSLLDQVKAAGGWPEWQEQTAASAEVAATEKAMAATAAAIEKAKLAEAAEAAAKAAAQEATAKAEAAEAAAKSAATAAPPPEIVEEVKAAGGWSAWLTKKATAATPPAPVVEKIDVPVKLGRRDSASIEMGRQVEALTGWKAAVLRWLL